MNARRFLCIGLLLSIPSFYPAVGAEVILEDHFERTEKDDTKEQVGGGWTTNSKGRAAGNKQVDLVDGALSVTRHPVADHAVSIVHDAAFTDGTIELRFKFGKGDAIHVDLADMNEKSVHAGHLAVVRVTPYNVSLVDHKTGPMKNEIREARQSGSLTKPMEQILDETQNVIKRNTAVDQWHELTVIVDGDRMSVSIDGQPVGHLTSPGIGHPTKQKIRLGVKQNAVIDDVIVTRQVAAPPPQQSKVEGRFEPLPSRQLATFPNMEQARTTVTGLLKLQAERQRYAIVYGAEHPKVHELDAEIELVKKFIAQSVNATAKRPSDQAGANDPLDVQKLNPGELRDLVQTLLRRVQALEAEVTTLKQRLPRTELLMDSIAR